MRGGSLLNFGSRVGFGFQRSQGFLLAGVVAYYTLLAMVPLFVVLLVGLSHVVDERQLLDTVASNLQRVLPSEAVVLIKQIESYLAHREVAGIVGLLVLVFFSSTAFAVISGALYAIRAVRVFGRTWPPAGLSGAVLCVLGVVGLALLLTAFYMVLPVGQIRFGHALAGGVTATVLLEVTRHVMVWYFATLSLVNVLCGPMAAAIVVLLTLDVAAAILLVGAEVIAETDRARLGRAGPGQAQL